MPWSIRRSLGLLCAVGLCLLATGCAERERVERLGQLADKEFAVPTGTIADQLVASVFPAARFKYFNTVYDSALAVQAGKADAAAYDEPVLRNIAAQNPGLRVLPDFITVDHYGYAVRQGDTRLKQAIDEVLAGLRGSDGYAALLARWLPDKGPPGPMPDIPLTGDNGVLRFGTAAITEPFSYIDASQQVVGLDVEIARLVARRLGMRLEVSNMDFGGMIPALISGKVDMIGACITITGERAQRVLFSEPYYQGGIAALVRE